MPGLRAGEAVGFFLRLKGVCVDAVDVVEDDVIRQRIRRRRNNLEHFRSAGGGDHGICRRYGRDYSLHDAWRKLAGGWGR